MRGLHRLYLASGLLSAASLVLICGLILAQVIARNLGSTVRDADEFAAWAMAAAGFFGLPYALYCGSHIRVSAVARFVPESLHHFMEVLASAIGMVLAAAMLINLLAAGIAGVLTPIALDRLDIDPAMASGVMVTTVTDVVGFFAFLGLATLLLL